MGSGLEKKPRSNEIGEGLGHPQLGTFAVKKTAFQVGSLQSLLRRGAGVRKNAAPAPNLIPIEKRK